MTIQSFTVAGTLRPGYALQNATQRLYRAAESKYSPPEKKFTTSYREDYCNWTLPRPASLKPPDNLTRSDAKFQAITSYQADYGYKTPAGPQGPEHQSLQRTIPYILQHAMKPTRPSKLQGCIYAPNAPAQLGGGTGSAPRMPKGEDPSSVPPTKMSREAVGGSGGARYSFAHSTEYKDNFKAWPMPPVYKHVYPPYDPPEGAMQFVTSYASDYRAWGDQTRPKILQREEFIRPKGSFQHTTTYLEEYRPKMAKPTRIRPAQRR